MSNDTRYGSFTFYFPEAKKPRKQIEPVIKVKRVTYDQRDSRNDCAVRAVAEYFAVPYVEALDLLKAHTDYSPLDGTSPDLMTALFETFGMKYVRARIRVNSKTAKDKLPHKAILHFSQHVAAYEDGTIIDTWYCTDAAGTKQTIGYWTEA